MNKVDEVYMNKVDEVYMDKIGAVQTTLLVLAV
jgi:hypothetical protein